MAKVQTIESIVFAFFIQIMHKYEKNANDSLENVCYCAYLALNAAYFICGNSFTLLDRTSFE